MNISERNLTNRKIKDSFANLMQSYVSGSTLYYLDGEGNVLKSEIYIPDYDAVSIEYNGPRKQVSKIDYKLNNEIVLSLSCSYSGSEFQNYNII